MSERCKDTSREKNAFFGLVIRALTIFDPLLMFRYLSRAVSPLRESSKCGKRDRQDRLTVFVKGNMFDSHLDGRRS